MNAYTLKIATVLSTLILFACSANKTTTDDSSEDVSEDLPTILSPSKRALEAPPYQAGLPLSGPLEMLDYHAPVMTGTDINNPVPSRNGERWMYALMWRNPTQDTVYVKSVEFEDDYFDIQWNSKEYFPPHVSSGCWLWTDSTVYKKDYKIIISYKDDKYPPQVFHLNFYPDMASYNADHKKQD